MRCLLTGWSLKFEANAEDNCRMALCRCTIMPVRYCCAHSWNLPGTQLWGTGSPSVQSQSRPFRLSPVCSTQGGVKGLSINLGPRTEGRYMRSSMLSQKHFFFSEGIKKLVQRWKKCIERQGDYVEKWCYYKFFYFYWNKVCICSADNYWLT